MAFSEINVGTAANDNTGDSLRDSFIKINDLIAYMNGQTSARFVTTNVAMTAETGTMVFVDTSSAIVVISLPDVVTLSPAVGTTVEIVDVAGTFATNNCVVTAPDGALIQRLAADLTLATNDEHIRIVYTGAVYGWLVI